MEGPIRLDSRNKTLLLWDSFVYLCFFGKNHDGGTSLACWTHCLKAPLLPPVRIDEDIALTSWMVPDFCIKIAGMLLLALLHCGKRGKEGEEGGERWVRE